MCKELYGIKFFPKQNEIASAIVATPVKEGVVDYHSVCCSRQFGKSTMLTMLLLHYAINEPNSRNLFCSLTYQQSNKVFNNLIKGIRDWGIITRKDGSEYSIELTNGSIIYCRSFARADSMRGLSCETVVLDEAAYCRDEDFQSVIRPILSTVGRRCLLFSTPKGDNFFKTMYDRGVSSEFPNYHSYFATYHDNPIANLTEIEDARRTLPEKIFRAEYGAEFVSGNLSVFDGYRECVNGTWLRGKTIGAIDVGNADDWTVLTLMNGNKVVCQFFWRHDTFENIINEIVDKLREYGVWKVWVEVNSLGSPFYEFLYKRVREQRVRTALEAWTTTNTSKANIVEQLRNDFVMRNIIIPNDTELMSQLDHFTCSYSTKSKVIVYGAENGWHDDAVLSLAIANYNRVVNTPSGKYHTTTV